MKKKSTGVNRRARAWLSFALVLTAVGLAHCGNSVLAPEENKLKRPLGLEIEALSDYRFALSFYVMNQEEIFTGYNLYASRSEITDADFFHNDLVQLVLPEGEQPTFAYNKSQFNTVNKERQVLRFFDGQRIRFEACQRYFFRIRAHSDIGRQSPGSNEVSAVAQDDPEDDTECEE